ncbi:hypothetical protein DMB38_22610 [Streptomyces sp. WAC 06738]|uniref:hypothetical protein n=1 Tax=Streptomyces sp. WAC 06738 TaxID=2203210 RepID=UPI000F6BD6B6|nr:hypothetical protein [Streptomyces sp. WAC 06738]AZM48206.1 hypothetical protein DMB38_22610 [Streptomyces sp. WAC 06738]
MRRHRFEPAKLVAGLVLLSGAAFALLDAADALRQPDWVPLVVVPPGLALAGLVAAVGYGARRARRRAREARAAAARDRDVDVDVGADLRGLPMDELRGTYDARFGTRDADGPGAGGSGADDSGADDSGADGDVDAGGRRRGPGSRA